MKVSGLRIEQLIPEPSARGEVPPIAGHGPHGNVRDTPAVEGYEMTDDGYIANVEWFDQRVAAAANPVTVRYDRDGQQCQIILDSLFGVGGCFIDAVADLRLAWQRHTDLRAIGPLGNQWEEER